MYSWQVKENRNYTLDWISILLSSGMKICIITLNTYIKALDTCEDALFRLQRYAMIIYD